MFKWRRLTLQQLIFLGLLVALTIILQQLSIGPATVKVGLAFIGNLILAYYYGPIWGSIGAGAADLVRSAILGNEGGFFPGFTLSAMLAVFIYAVFLYRQEIKIWRVVVATLLVTLIVNVVLNTYWLHLVYGLNLQAALSQRLLKELIVPWFQMVIGYLVLKALVRVKIDKSFDL